uniref:NADH-ubiquinone oxidoreductase chain 6 n=1 Tax=Cynoglossus quadrilineatus TaxID=3073681 RepID=V9IN33_9PLEU|nr:NADH dehydrogenase subunit 6 [Cynoglossus quadrilineatus]AFB71245.1 NADH dehydrogenase subunit 6 [Cynoglossus quadrilineatus]
MMFITYVALLTLMLGLVAVASNPSPYFAALGLVAVAGGGCVVLVGYGGTFLSLVLFLIYLGGMLVVFAYTSALAADPYPKGLGNPYVLFYGLLYVMIIMLVPVKMLSCWESDGWWADVESLGFMISSMDTSGLSVLYSCGGILLAISGFMLLLTLFVVLELTRGMSRGSLRCV